MNITKAQISAVLVAMAAVSGTAYAAAPSSNTNAFNESTSFTSTQTALGGLSIGTLPAGIQTVVNNLATYRAEEQTKNNNLVVLDNAAIAAVGAKETAIANQNTLILNLIAANPLDATIPAQQLALATLQGDLAALQAAQVVTSSNVQNSTIKIALYDQAISGPVANAQTAAANAAQAITQARAQFNAGVDTTNPDYAATGTAGLQAVVDTVAAVSSGDQAPVTTAITTADATFAGIGSANATVLQIQDLVNVINTQLPTLPAISNTDKNAALGLVLNGSYERAAIVANTTAGATNTAAIATNAGNIATNAASIATNTADIATNAGNIATNAANIATNTADIATNAGNIATNAANIATNTADIATNAGNIATEVATRTALIRQEANGIHIGANSLITNEVGGVQQLFAQDAFAAPINIDITNGSDLLVNGVSVATDADVAAEAATRLAQDGILQANITAEVNRATAAEGVLQGNINAEAATRLAQDGILQGNITAEVNRATAAEGVLQGNINTETAARIAADNTLTTSINTERTRALAAEAVLGGRVTTLENQVSNVYQNLKVIRKGVAMSAALQTPVINQGDKSAVSISAAVFDGEEGLSVGYARRINANTTVNASVATGFPEVLARGGLNYSF